MSNEGWGPGSRSGEANSTPASGRLRARGRIDDEHWSLLNRTVRFYGFVALVGTKLADAVTTVVGIRYVPGIVELNPVAGAVFADNGILVGLAVLSFATIAVATLCAEYLAVEVRRRLAMDRLALLAKGVVYGALSLLFGVVAVNNALLISGQLQGYFSEMLVFAAVVV